MKFINIPLCDEAHRALVARAKESRRAMRCEAQVIIERAVLATGAPEPRPGNGTEPNLHTAAPPGRGVQTSTGLAAGKTATI